MDKWTYPFWIAHRGAGQLAPENTLAAFRVGAQYGYRMFECDAKLSADDIVFLLHDATLNRTTPINGKAIDYSWDQLSRLDAGCWHSKLYAGEPLCLLTALAQFCIANDFALNIEIKPSPGTDFKTGFVVAQEAAQLWGSESTLPLLTSFKPLALEGAISAAPDLPKGLLLDSLWSGWFESAVELGCATIIARHDLWSAHTIDQVQATGMKALCYTVNSPTAAKSLIQLGIDGIITDRIDIFKP